MEHNKCNRTIILSILALSVSSVTIALFFIKVTPNSVVDSITFISILAAFIGISVAFLVGYQVYNAVEIKQELSKIDALKKEVDKSKSELDKQKQELDKKLESLKNEMEISRCISLSRADSEHNPIMAFIRLHEALQFILSSDSSREDIKWYKEELNERMEHISKADFGIDVEKGIQTLQNDYQDDMVKIKAHEKYYIVQDWYENLMARFGKYLDGMVKTVLEEKVETYSS